MKVHLHILRSTKYRRHGGSRILTVNAKTCWYTVPLHIRRNTGPSLKQAHPRASPPWQNSDGPEVYVFSWTAPAREYRLSKEQWRQAILYLHTIRVAHGKQDPTNMKEGWLHGTSTRKDTAPSPIFLWHNTKPSFLHSSVITSVAGTRTLIMSYIHWRGVAWIDVFIGCTTQLCYRIGWPAYTIQTLPLWARSRVVYSP